MPEAARSSTVIAFDFGLRRIGVAVGQTITGSASPLGIIGNTDRGPDNSRIDALIQEWQPDVLVVGLPLLASGHAGEMAAPVRAFAIALEAYGRPVELVDERLSSREAKQQLIDARRMGSHGRIQKADIDAAAAVLIAERYLSRMNEKPPHKNL